jgi:hypothetical protein
MVFAGWRGPGEEVPHDQPYRRYDRLVASSWRVA